VNAIVLPDDLMATALDTADAIASNAPLACATWRGVRELLHLSLVDAYRRQEESAARSGARTTRAGRSAPSSRSAGHAGGR
jgi:enoyl-CoA hydratase/carnithine racemase